jgi:hypothetical protein
MHKPDVEMISLRNAEMPENTDVLTVARNGHSRQYSRMKKPYIIHPTPCYAKPSKYETSLYVVCNFRDVIRHA